MADRSLQEVTHFMCARITAMSEITAPQDASSFNAEVIEELAKSLALMPFNVGEARFLREELAPLVAKHGKYQLGSPVNIWMAPVLKLYRQEFSPLADANYLTSLKQSILPGQASPL